MAIKKIVFLYDDGKTETYNGQDAQAFLNMMKNLGSLASAHGSQISWPVAEKGALPTHDAPEEFKHKELPLTNVVSVPLGGISGVSAMNTPNLIPNGDTAKVAEGIIRKTVKRIVGSVKKVKKPKTGKKKK